MKAMRLLTEDQIKRVKERATAEFRLYHKIHESLAYATQFALFKEFKKVWDELADSELITLLQFHDDSLIPRFYQILRGEASNEQ